jgi:hypothetical protein
MLESIEFFNNLLEPLANSIAKFDSMLSRERMSKPQAAFLHPR